MYKSRVLSGYRRLFRARSKLFVGDHHAIRESRIAIKAEFDRNRFLTDAIQIEACLSGINEAEDMLLHQIMRGVVNERGNYEVKIDKEHVKGSTTMNPTEMATIEPITAAKTLEPSDIKVTKTSPGGARDERL